MKKKLTLTAVHSLRKEAEAAQMRMFMKVHSVFTKVHSRGAVLRARRLRLPRTLPRGAVCAAGV